MKFAMIALALLSMGVVACSSSGNGGATGAEPERYMGERPNVNGTWNGSTSSSSMLMQRIKQESASGGASTRY